MKMLHGEHHDVRLDPREVELIRHWIHCGAPYIGTYAALLQGMIGSTGYEKSHFTAIDTRILRNKAVRAAEQVIERRCIGRHEGVRSLPKHPADWGQGTKLIQPQRAWMIKKKDNRAVWRFQQHILYNLTHPEQSVQLLAPLAENAGGYGTCREPNGEVASVFESRDDLDYQLLLAAIRNAKALHDSDPRWDTPGWKAPPEDVREMKRHGILPESFDRDLHPLDPYETDRRYWHAVTGHHPPGTEPVLHSNPEFREMCLSGTLTADGDRFHSRHRARLHLGPSPTPRSSSSAPNREP